MGFTIRVDTSGLEARIRSSVSELRKVSGGVKVDGSNPVPFVLEFGSKAGSKPWPQARQKTTAGPNGRIFSKQAPRGYVGVNAGKIAEFLRDALASRLGKRLPSREVLRAAANEAISNAFSLLRAAIPKDTGGAAGSLEIEKAK